MPQQCLIRLYGLLAVLFLGVAVVGCWRMHSELCLRRGVEVRISDSHSDYFASGKQAIRADLRAALVLDRAAAFCLVTGV